MTIPRHLKISSAERLPAMLFLLVIVVFQYLIISKFWCLFADFSEASFLRFIRNFHMSGFDPYTYDVVTSWHQGYDLLRHPLLALLMYPLYLLNQLLGAITGCNCVQLVVGMLLTFCGFYSSLFLFRTMHLYIGISRVYATLLTLLFLMFAYVIVSIIVPDHFCLSLFCLTLTVMIAAEKLKHGQRFKVLPAALLLFFTAGITLSNGLVVMMVVFLTNGRRFFLPRWFSRAVVAPLVLLSVIGVSVFFLTSTPADKALVQPVADQMKWIRQDVSKAEVLQENFFGESLQLHRQHVLGDVLRRRPVVVRYTWPAQNYVTILIQLLLLAGLIVGGLAHDWRRRFTLILLAVLGFNILLHIVLAFAIDEVYIMTAHWAFVIPLALANLFLHPNRPLRVVLFVLLLTLTLYLSAYHGYLLHRYLTWPLTPA